MICYIFLPPPAAYSCLTVVRSRFKSSAGRIKVKGAGAGSARPAGPPGPRTDPPRGSLSLLSAAAPPPEPAKIGANSIMPESRGVTGGNFGAEELSCYICFAINRREYFTVEGNGTTRKGNMTINLFFMDSRQQQKHKDSTVLRPNHFAGTSEDT